jgi:predicted ester cyclase
MSIEENKAFIRRYLAALSGKEKPASVVDQYVADSDPELKQHIVDAEQGFPLYELVEEDLIAEGDQVVLKCRLVGTHNGTFMGIPATGKSVDVPVALIYRIADGKIASHWMLSDNMAMMQQIGVIPAPDAAS